MSHTDLSAIDNDSLPGRAAHYVPEEGSCWGAIIVKRISSNDADGIIAHLTATDPYTGSGFFYENVPYGVGDDPTYPHWTTTGHIHTFEIESNVPEETEFPEWIVPSGFDIEVPSGYIE